MKADTTLPFMIALQMCLILAMSASIKFTVCVAQDVQKMLGLSKDNIYGSHVVMHCS